MRKSLLICLPLLVAAAAFGLYFALHSNPVPTNRDAVASVTTIAGAGYPDSEDGPALAASFSDPFGVAIDSRGNLIIADGGQANRIRVLSVEGNVTTLAGSGEGYSDDVARSSAFNTPSGVAIDPEGNIIVSDTSNHCIRKIEKNGRVVTVAGSGSPGYKDGQGSGASFDGPLGVAVDSSGAVYVADTYNDRIRKITPDGSVSTLAGAGRPGRGDGQRESALFDTPCGLAVDAQGNIFVTDTGNGLVRKISAEGEVSTLIDAQGSPLEFSRPLGIAVTHDGFLFISDEEEGAIYRVSPGNEVSKYAGHRPGFANGVGELARFNGPSGVAVDSEGNLYVADTKNYLIRKVTPRLGIDPAAEATQWVYVQPPAEAKVSSPDSIIPRLGAALLAVGESFPWPLNPQNQPHEVTGVVGEARGAPGGVALHHLHGGLDIRGNMGEAVVSIIDEKTISPLPSWGFGGPNEGIALGLISYIHIRVGRDVKDEIRTPDRFKPRFDETGKQIGVRIRRGTRFGVGEFIGTLNRLYHVHLNFGPWNAQANPIEFPFIGFRDTIAPVVEPDGIEVADASGKPFKPTREGRLVISGDVDIVVTAYDRVDGNGANRKLGIYKAGYQLLNEDGSPAAGFAEPLINLIFNRLPPGDESAFKVYAEGSGVSAYGTPTKFKYVLTNLVRDGQAADGFLRTADLRPGNYILRVVLEDFAGNKASGKTTERRVTIPAP